MFPPGSDKFDVLEFEVNKYDEYLPRSEVERIIAAGSPTMGRSPKMSKSTQKQKAVQKLQQNQSPLSIKNFHTAPINDFGITQPVMQYLEVSLRLPKSGEL